MLELYIVLFVATLGVGGAIVVGLIFRFHGRKNSISVEERGNTRQYYGDAELLGIVLPRKRR